MKLTDLLERLPEGTVRRVSLADPDCDVYSVAFLTPQQLASPHGDVLYFSDSVTLPARVPEGRQFCCVVVDGGEEVDTLADSPDANIAWLDDGADLFACYNAVQGIFLEDQQVAAIVKRLLAAHFSNQGLQYLIEEAAHALSNPIVVVDPAYRYIAYHLGDLPEDDTQLARVMTEEIANETVLEEAVAYIRDRRIDSAIARAKGAFEDYNEILQCKTLTTAVMVNHVCVAHVMMMERAHAFDDLDREVFVRLANFVAQEMQKSEVWGPTSGELGSYFLENLLNDRAPSVAVTRRRMKALNFHPKPLLFVACLHAPGEGLSQLQVEHVAAQLRPVLHHSLYTRHHQQLVALISRDEDEGFSERTERKLREVAALNGLTVGISNAFRALTDARAAYEQARAAVRYGSSGAGTLDEDRLFHYRDYAYLRLLELGGRRMSLLSLCHPALVSLMEYDEAHGGELMETLFCYLEVAGSTARAARLLTLHKNTMLYRLGRIKEILGMSLTSGEDLFALQLSFRALMSLGLFSPRLRLSRDDLQG